MSRLDRSLAILESIGFSSSTRYHRFAELGKAMGIKILRPQESTTLEGIKQSWKEAEEMSKTADSFLISGLGIDDQDALWTIDRIEQSGQIYQTGETNDPSVTRTHLFMCLDFVVFVGY